MAHFYAGFHGNKEEPTARPSAQETEAANEYVQRLLAVWSDEKQTPAWGRSFGEMVSYHQRKLQKELPSFLLALRTYGDGFLTALVEERKAAAKEAQERAQVEHAHRFTEAYRNYLRTEEASIREEEPEAYRAFEQDRHRTWEPIEKNKMLTHVDALREKFHSEESRLEAFEHFFLLHEPRILHFWEWDEQRNPEPFDKGRVNT